MTGLVLTFEENLTDVWEGYFINHLVPEEHINSSKTHLSPNNIDWERDSMPGVYLVKQKPIIVKYLWAGVEYLLEVNPESEIDPDTGKREKLSKPEPVVLIGFDYGNFANLLPEKQDRIFYGYYREALGDPVTPVSYKVYHNYLPNIGDKDEIAEGRRKLSKNYVKQRAVEIENITNGLFESLGNTQATALGLTQIELSAGIASFYQSFSDLMVVFQESGYLGINEAIANVMSSTTPNDNDWMRQNILIGKNPDGSLILVPAGAIIQQVFAESVAPVIQEEINAALKLT